MFVYAVLLNDTEVVAEERKKRTTRKLLDPEFALGVDGGGEEPGQRGMEVDVRAGCIACVKFLKRDQQGLFAEVVGSYACVEDLHGSVIACGGE